MRDLRSVQECGPLPLSVIIPTYQEVARLGLRVEELLPADPREIIIVDGGSTDGTCELARDLARKHSRVAFATATRGRSMQMNAGARMARGEWLLFLHADTVMTDETLFHWHRAVRQDVSLIGGAFSFRLDHPALRYRAMEWYVNRRSRLLTLPLGDQGIFVRRSVFHQLKGYREDYPLLEDRDLVGRLRRFGPFRVLDIPVITSARRIEADGYWKRSLYNFLIQTLFSLGVHPRRLTLWY